MKKLFTLLLTFAMVFSLVACGSDTEEISTGETSGLVQDSEENVQKEKPIDFKEIVVVENEECLIKITGIDPDNMWGYTLKAQFENKSADKVYMFSVDHAAVNGVESDPFFASEVAAGKKSVEEISFTDSDLEENGVGEFTDIELAFRVYDSNDWMADAVAEETVHIYPYGEEKATAFIRESQPSDTVIVDNEFVTAIVIGYDTDDIWGYTANLYLVNKTDSAVMFSVDNASVNGFMADPFYAHEVAAGKCAFSAMSWGDTTLEECGITTVEEIEFAFTAYASDDWSGEHYVNEIVTLIP